MSSPLGSAASWSSCRCRRSSSPESRVPRRSLHAAQLGQPLPQPELGLTRQASHPPRTGAAGGRASGAAPAAARSRRRGRSAGSTRRDRSRPAASRASSVHDARAGERHQRARLGERARRRAPRSWRSRRRSSGGRARRCSAQPASCRSSTAQTVFGSCISARMPSCMRAPPDADTDTSGTPPRARVAGAGELLAHDAAHRAAHEGEVHDREPARPPLDRGRADDHRVAEAGRELGLGEPLAVGRRSKNASGSAERRSGRPPRGRARVGELLDALDGARPGSGGRTAGRREVLASSSSSR